MLLSGGIDFFFLTQQQVLKSFSTMKENPKIISICEFACLCKKHSYIQSEILFPEIEFHQQWQERVTLMDLEVAIVLNLAISSKIQLGKKITMQLSPLLLKIIPFFIILS